MGKHGRRNRNRQQNQYQDEGNDAQDFFDSRRGFQKPNSKQSLNPFERYLRLPPPYQATNPHPRPNSSAFLHPSHNPRSQGRNPFSNTPHGPRIPPDPNLAKRKNRQRTLKRFLIQTLNTAVQKINLYLPDNDAFSSSDSDTEEEMDWQPEHEVIIPQPFEVVYPWPAGDVRGCFERAAWGEGENGYAREMEERVKLKLERGVWMANANRGLNGDGATGRRVSNHQCLRTLPPFQCPTPPQPSAPPKPIPTVSLTCSEKSNCGAILNPASTPLIHNSIFSSCFRLSSSIWSWERAARRSRGWTRFLLSRRVRVCATLGLLVLGLRGWG